MLPSSNILRIHEPVSMFLRTFSDMNIFDFLSARGESGQVERPELFGQVVFEWRLASPAR